MNNEFSVAHEERESLKFFVGLMYFTALAIVSYVYFLPFLSSLIQK